MSYRLLCCAILMVFYACSELPPPASSGTDSTTQSEITFTTPDGLKVYGDLHSRDKEGPSILLFHQGGSNARAEYGPILPRLLEEDYNVLAIDQRMGGQYYGGYNRTLVNVKDHGYDNPYTYCDAYDNLEGALDYLIDAGYTGPKILWGSSYSAALALRLAHERQEDVSGVLAFSPASGRPMEGCQPDSILNILTVPAMVLHPPNEMENETTRQRMAAAGERGIQAFAPARGVHGSSMLVAERAGGDVEDTWRAVLAFLQQLR